MIALALILAAAPTKIVFTSPAGSVGTGACSPVVTVEAQDASGVASPPPSSLTVFVSGAAAYFPAAGCSSLPLDPQGDLQLTPGGSGRVSFRFIVPDAGSLTLGATAGTFPAASQSWTVTPAPGEPVGVGFTIPPIALGSSECSPALPFRVQDLNGAAATLDRAVEVSFGPTGYIEVYSAANCSGPRAFSIPFAQGAAPTGTVYVRTALTGQVTLEARSPGLHTGTLQLNVAPAKGGGCASAADLGPLAALAGLAFAFRRRRA